jgi:glutaminyl-peptide cyclotransferase
MSLAAALAVILLSGNRAITAQPASPPSSTSTAVALNFDGQRAFRHLEAQVKAGPRLPGSPGLQVTRNLILNTLSEAGWTTGTQSFAAPSGVLNQTVPGLNIFATYPKGAKVKYLISAHYDTRPISDQEPDPTKRQIPVPGANDGASGVAALLELARVIPLQKLPHGIGLAFFDLEDHGTPRSNDGFCKGSRHMAANLPPELDFEHGINLDMIADKELSLSYESFSFTQQTALTERLWNVGIELYPQAWKAERGPFVYDDHMPFLTTGRSYINVIDFDYKPWHTTEDTADKCSPQSLEIVGRTIEKFIQN